MDWAPTLCEAMGIEIVSKLNEKKKTNYAFGLGRSLFKASEMENKTLISELGSDEFSLRVQEPSRKYEELF